jgi:hypothetical protein
VRTSGSGNGVLSKPTTHAALLAAVQGFAVGLSRVQAFVLLAASDDPEREVLLSGVLENPSEDSRLRAAAAIALGHILSDKSAELLAQALWTAPPEVLPDVLRSLGRVGRPDDLGEIDRHLSSAHTLIAKAARFSAALISHRFGLDGHDLPPIDPSEIIAEPTGDERPLEVAKASSEEVRAVLASMAREPYGIELATNSLTEFRCGTEAHTLCLNHRLVEKGSAAALLERKSLVALAALRSREGAGHSVSYIVLASPSGQNGVVNLYAPLCAGVPALVGSARPSRHDIHFSLRSINRPGARGIFLDGRVEHGEITMTRATVSRSRRPAPSPGHADA